MDEGLKETGRVVYKKAGELICWQCWVCHAGEHFSRIFRDLAWAKIDEKVTDK